MTQTRSLSLILFGVFTAMALVFGLWEVGWSFARLPVWFPAYALAMGLVGVLTYRLQQLDHPQRPGWQRLWLRGFANVLPLTALTSVGEVLDGSFKNPALLAAFVGTWTIVALLSGGLFLWLERKARQGQPTAQKLKDWF